jgi:hypothetical protein
MHGPQPAQFAPVDSFQAFVVGKFHFRRFFDVLHQLWKLLVWMSKPDRLYVCEAMCWVLGTRSDKKMHQCSRIFPAVERQRQLPRFENIENSIDLSESIARFSGNIDVAGSCCLNALM